MPERQSGRTRHFTPFSESKSSGIYACCASLHIWPIGRRGFSLCLAMQNLLAAGFAFSHPNDGTEKSVRPARAAASPFASRRMLPYFVFLWGYAYPSPCPFIPKQQSGRARLSRPRRRFPFPEDKILRIGSCPGSIMLTPHYNYSKGVWGFAPCSPRLLTFHTRTAKRQSPPFPPASPAPLPRGKKPPHRLLTRLNHANPSL